MSDDIRRDERTVAVENASYKWAYIVLTYALLLDVMYRGLMREEAAWDLLAFVAAGAVVCTAYQARQKTLAGNWAIWSLVFAGLAAVIGAIAAFMLQ